MRYAIRVKCALCNELTFWTCKHGLCPCCEMSHGCKKCNLEDAPAREIALHHAMVASILEAAQERQSQYWDALHDLEQVLGIQIELAGTGGDLSSYTVDSLMQEFGNTHTQK